MGQTQFESLRSIVLGNCGPDGAAGKEDTMGRDNEWDEWVRDYYEGEDGGAESSSD
ncbi:hypothetical protein [Curtobacterium sp. MCLR17_039]|uniref:hypothetical protein n=1 Tax=Curtobacterium sp. MCLR17_039 TaxID=2175624 RepID=UPI0015E8B2C1|nr:hypothetical protein [Curtobacterium sp. MCLR17_039]